MSHPSWVCGLKLSTLSGIAGAVSVTPFVGVWIETIPCVVATSTVPSHPLWVCGLNLVTCLLHLVQIGAPA